MTDPQTPPRPDEDPGKYESPRLLWIEDYAALAFGATCAKTQLIRSCRFGPLKS